MREEQTEVLVVGAGPVGLWTALLLTRSGLEVMIIDRESRTTTRSYACGLHPKTLQMLEPAGLATGLIKQGRQIPTVAFYEGLERKAEISIGESGDRFPFLLILPQSALEAALEQALQAAHIPVNWNHRFEAFDSREDEVVVSLEELGGTSTGYAVPHWENVVKRRFNVIAQFLVGADGHNSVIRQRMGIDYQRVAGPDFFVACEFSSDQPGADELRVVLDEGTVNVLWPLPENRFRWTFQVNRADLAQEFPEKERRFARLAAKEADDRLRDFLRRMIAKRAPWFSGTLGEVSWCTEVAFEHRLAAKLVAGRCCLLGDAAHQTGPVGVQSMNAGFLEAEALVGLLKDQLREEQLLASLENYNKTQERCWRALLGVEGGLKAASGATPWITAHSQAILPCLPAVDQRLRGLAGQLLLEAHGFPK